ncbi:tRNA (adenosine(37)-N6)-threonylcarbamoyltransferase complex dimerization subunit type 1 TsaB [Flavobacterium sp. ASW18X]|uniref:tRNA (adenosine(37)-N6)-threonylcarbamoyltransferase complex dimerization subunit type 1 TsaB n=1 Tax=Flavobacterium sp. ASW18X TaxID=2572595 RepID=UPI0010AE9A75|nr:tRNA (adenosine(37)-N6)-threonylcarbamoyltransferase complex dimerization subunit type 1 TsaB [Flavobacterium sp. ASW18X]TKD66654.1 tRNA (adenosine(37)-N6)-threonylcarbamoyltransferase complex dimerization subunit type 1 TsaB [Flavobacterium sp. ASW18X]
MARILNLETATTNCSVSIGVNGELVSLVEENTANYSHAEQLHLFIKEALKKASLSFLDIDAIAVSKGPGSYTGLRIGVSAAKGLSFSLDKPLIAVPTLESLAHQIEIPTGDFIVPVLDARRMEVYSCVFDVNYKEIRATDAEIITEESFADYATKGNVHLVGNGAEKCMEQLGTDKFSYHTEKVPSAAQMAHLSFIKYKQQQFEDVAYFEPYYLKDFVLQTKKKKA